MPAPDRAADFERLYDAHRHAVRSYFLGRHDDPTVADELMQETFLRVWRRIEEITGLEAGAQRGWIFTVARNLSTDAYRSSATRRATVSTLRHEAVVLAPAAADPADEAVLRDRVARLDRAIAALPEPMRVVVTMSAAGGMNSTEIADALGEPAGTVRYRLSMARRRLTSAMQTGEEPTDVRA